MKGTLIIYTLSITSSYKDNSEAFADEYFDVIEFWINEKETYRMKTYSKDQDIHVYQWGHDGIESAIDLAYETTDEHYGDAKVKSFRIDFNENETEIEIQNKFDVLNLKGRIEISDFIFWNPDRREYKTISNPVLKTI
jgi:hypothetical protein